MPMLVIAVIRALVCFLNGTLGVDTALLSASWLEHEQFLKRLRRLVDPFGMRVEMHPIKYAAASQLKEDLVDDL